jgi:hypothetical protein
MGKEAVLATFEVLSQSFAGGIGKNRENISQDGRSRDRAMNAILQE